MKEYKFVTGNLDHCQKVLNQWKRQYTIEIIRSHFTDPVEAEDYTTAVILVTREPIK